MLPCPSWKSIYNSSKALFKIINKKNVALINKYTNYSVELIEGGFHNDTTGDPNS